MSNHVFTSLKMYEFESELYEESSYFRKKLIQTYFLNYMSNVLNQYVWFGLLKRLTTKSQNLEQKNESLGAEKVQLKFCKYLLRVHKSAANNAVRAELDIFPVEIY